MTPPRSSPTANRYRAAAVCTPGLESICADELRGIGAKPKPAGPGLLEFEANARLLYAANVWLRTAGRVMVRVATFRATDFVHLQDHASQIDWARWIPQGHAPRFRISTNDSKLYHTKAIAQRLHQVSLPPSIGEPEQLVIIRIDRNNVTVSIDTSGEALYKRPWRTELGQAPLRTTMASAVLTAAEWDPTSDLVDPFCGSGTIGIEAALQAAGLPPAGRPGDEGRTYAFQHWAEFDAGSWASVAGSIQAAAVALDKARPPARIRLSDRDGAMVAMATANAERAGVADLIEFDTHVLSHIKGRSGPGLVLTNPPFGKRIGQGELHKLYGRLGAVVRDRLPAHTLAVLTADQRLAKAADGRLRPVVRFRHGGLPVELFARPPADSPADSPAEPASESVADSVGDSAAATG